jgi:hypothetical protein
LELPLLFVVTPSGELGYLGARIAAQLTTPLLGEELL